MEYSELLTGWRNKKVSHAAAQRRGELSKTGSSRCVAAPLREKFLFRCLKSNTPLSDNPFWSSLAV